MSGDVEGRLREVSVRATHWCQRRERRRISLLCTRHIQRFTSLDNTVSLNTALFVILANFNVTRMSMYGISVYRLPIYTCTIVPLLSHDLSFSAENSPLL